MQDQMQFRPESTFLGVPPTIAPTFGPLEPVSLLEVPVVPGRAVELLVLLEVWEVLAALKVVAGSGISSGSPSQTSKQSRGGWFEVELTSDSYHGGLVVRLVSGRLCIQSQHQHANKKDHLP